MSNHSERVGISVRGTNKVYASDPPLVALEKIELDVPDGQFVSILGPSGCGKSTLLNLVAGFEQATAGQIKVFGEDVRAPGPDRAVVFQDATLMPWLSVWNNIVLSAKLKGQHESVYKKLAEELVAAVGLKGFEHHLPAQLSGGMRQRVGIARALLMRPKVLLMDEPFGALDAQTRLQMQELLLRVWSAYKKTVLFVTHDIDEAILLSDVVYVMSPRPGRFTTRLAIELPRPRSADQLTTDRFNALRKTVFEAIRLVH